MAASSCQEKFDEQTFFTADSLFHIASLMLDSMQIGALDDQIRDQVRHIAAEINRQAMDYCHKACRQMNSAELLVRAYGYAGRCKNRLLNEKISTRRALSEAKIPSDSLKKLYKLDEMIVHEQNLISKTGFIAQASLASRLDSLSSTLASLFTERSDYCKRLERIYPDFGKVRYSFMNPSLKNIQSHLNRDQVILDYVFGPASHQFYPLHLYCFLVSSDTFLLKDIPVGLQLIQAIGDVARYVSEKPDRYNQVKDKGVKNEAKQELIEYQKFLSGSVFLYELLLKPLEPWIQGKSLLISADRQLTGLPFEALLCSSPSVTDNYHFRNLSFAVQKYPISYIPSPGLTFFDVPVKRSLRSVLAIAPDYRYFNERTIQLGFFNHHESVNSKGRDRNEAREKFRNLPGTSEECLFLKDRYHATVLLDTQATRSSFLARAPQYDILHLAMHGFMNEGNPSLSRLAFSPVDSLDEAFFLHSHEIQYISLKAGLIVLAACQSDAGKYDQSEGIQSTARSMFLNRVPVIISSGWNVDDYSSGKILVSFYESFFAGNSPDRALQQAKLNFLKEADEQHAHPYFWAGYRCLGNPALVTALSSTWGKFTWILLVTSLIFLLLILLYKAKKRFRV